MYLRLHNNQEYSKLCVRAVLVKILELNWTTWFVMLVLMVVRAIWIKVRFVLKQG